MARNLPIEVENLYQTICSQVGVPSTITRVPDDGSSTCSLETGVLLLVSYALMSKNQDHSLNATEMLRVILSPCLSDEQFTWLLLRCKNRELIAIKIILDLGVQVLKSLADKEFAKRQLNAN